MDKLIKELNIDKNRITGVSNKSAAWNVKMIASTALLCAFSIAPYIYLNLDANNLRSAFLEQIKRFLGPDWRISSGRERKIDEGVEGELLEETPDAP